MMASLPVLLRRAGTFYSWEQPKGRGPAPTREVKYCVNKSKSALHIPRFPTEHASFHYGACLLSLRSMPPFATEHASCSCRAMLLDTWGYAFGHVELCFWTQKAMLLKSESNAFEVGKLCFWGRKAMLLGPRSYAFRSCESFRGGCWVILIWHVTSFFMAVALVFSGSCYPCRIAFSNALQSYEKFPRYAIAIGKKPWFLIFIITLHFNRFPLYKFYKTSSSSSSS